MSDRRSISERSECPECGGVWKYDAPGVDYQLSHLIGLSDWDGIYGWMCPHCRHEWIFNQPRADRHFRNQAKARKERFRRAGG